MTEQELDSAHISSSLQEMDRESVPHGVRGDRFGDAGGSMRFPARQLDSIPGDVVARDITREEPRLGLFETPPAPEDFQQSGGEHGVAIFLPLAEFDADDHALAVDMSGFQPDGLGDAQPSGVASG